MDLLELFCDVDDFWQAFSPQWQRHLLQAGLPHRTRCLQLCESEIMTLVIHFHHSGYRNFKSYYTEYVSTFLTSEFPRLVSYNRFVELMPRVLIPLWFYLHSRKGPVTGISFIDSTPLSVCHNRRIASHKVFDGIAQRGKRSVGWFYGFRLHLLINEHGELLAVTITAGNVDDRKPVARFFVNVISGLIAYSHQEKKPSLNLSAGDRALVPVQSRTHVY